MSILDKIVLDKLKEVEIIKQKYSHDFFEKNGFFSRKCNSLAQNIKKTSGIIAEHKRASPSKSVINNHSKLEDVILGYTNAGVAGISVLTDEKYFGGKLEDLQKARDLTKTPILRKDFLVDEIQVLQAKYIGADAILLISEILTKQQIFDFSKLAKLLGMDVLMEIHSKKQLNKICKNIDIVGVNNRNLKTFETSIQNSIDLFDDISNEFVKISESGISNVENIKILQKVGFDGFLIGENFMKTNNPGKACKEFLGAI